MNRLSDKLLSWASILDDVTREQALRISRLSIVYPHVALMPDAHLGKGATVGSVVPTINAVIPAAVGVDIGCGMIAVETGLTLGDMPDDLGSLREAIQGAVPASAGGYNRVITQTAARRVETLSHAAIDAGFVPADYAANWPYQLGTLGAGNHFIEVSCDTSYRIWIVIHSGSRGVGNKIAQHHIKAAQHFHEVQGTELEDPDLAWLVHGTPEFARYIAAMRWAQRFAWLNREEMMDRVLWCLSTVIDGDRLDDVRHVDTVHCHHNYTTQETHYGQNVWLTRKGAIAAHRGTRGIIPGSMADATHIVRGLGNSYALASAPHGAGRQHSRRRARELFTPELLQLRMKDVEYDRERGSKFLDEIPDAYKPIEQVMLDAADLVQIETTLTQLVNVKGD